MADDKPPPDKPPDTAEKLPGDETQDTLFETPPDWTETWRGMPDYSQANLMPGQTVLVHFRNQRDRQAFAEHIGQTLHSRTKFIWYPKAEIEKASTQLYKSSEKVAPRYPVYIISKGRWESRLTSKALEFIGVPYHIVVEPQEYAQYAAVIDPAKILTLPFSNLGLGGIPARNWVWEHAIGTGAERHWILDDNIDGFCRFQKNMKIEVNTGVTFCAIEDFVDRYENVAMAGFNYDYFAPRKQGAKIRPYTLNTRIYSGILLRNDLKNADGTPMRWRGRYNEDTDLSLRILKDGWCTVLFNAFLMYKRPTLTMKGGNSDELYKDDGRLKMSESLKEQHPDCVETVWKWNRWAHVVDYRAFEKNALKLKPGIVISEEDEQKYEMTLGTLTDEDRQALVDAGFTYFGDRMETQGETPETGPEKPADTKQAASTQAAKPKPTPSTLPSGPSVFDLLPPEDPSPVSPVSSEPIPIEDDGLDEIIVAAMIPDFAKRGHRFLTRDGRLFTTHASRLTDEDRAQIALYKDTLLAHAAPWPAPGHDPEPYHAPTVSGVSAPAVEWYQPDEPPDLTGITDVVINFATTGLEWANGHRPCGLTVSTLDGQLTRFLPFGFRGGGNLDEATVKRFAQRQLRGKKLHGAKIRFDIHQSREWGVDLEEQGNTFTDIQHTAALLDDHRKQFALDVLARDYLSEDAVQRLDETQHADYSPTQVDRRERYTAQLVGKLHHVLYPQLKEQELERVQALEDAVISCGVEMEKNGALLDLELLAAFRKECHSREQQLLWAVSREVGFAFDRSNKSWQRLFEKYNLNVAFLADKEKDGKIVAGKSSFKDEYLAAIDHPVVQQARLSAQFASLASKTFDAYHPDANGILRFDLNQLRSDDGGTVSGRFSAGLIQQVPNAYNHKQVFGDDLNPRQLFISSTGTVAAVDAAQIELRIFSHHAKNPRILAAYAANPRISYHREIMAMIEPHRPGIAYEPLKNHNFAIIYGAGLPKSGFMMGFISAAVADEISDAKTGRTDPRLDETRAIREIYNRVLPEVAPLLAKSAHLAQPECNDRCRPGDALHQQFPHRGYVKTLLGRRSRFPNGYATHKALNRVIQGSAADVMKQKLVELHARRKETGFLMRMTIHDEVVGDCADTETLVKISAILDQQSFPELRVPILWEGKTGPTWAACK